MLADEVREARNGLGLGDVEFHGGFADVEVDFIRCAADVAEVGVSHFAWAVDDAAHHGDAHAFEVAGGGADFLGGVLKVEKRPAAARAGDVICLKNAGACGLENVIGEPQRLAGRSFTANENRIADAVAKQ